jgi:hypothetical protein
MVLFDSAYIHLEYYAKHRVIVSQWYGGCSSQQYRDAVNMTSGYIKSMQIPFAISDRRMLPPLSQEDMDWTMSAYIKEFCRLPLKRLAVLYSFDEAAAEQLHLFLNNRQYPIPFQVEVFDDLTSAYEWLVSVEAR